MSELENVDLIVASKDESYGGILKLEREKKGLSIEEVSDDLHLDRKIIYALENHNLEDLPEPAFVCGYIRNYARFLKLQPEPIVADFKKKVSLSADINAINTVGDLSYSRQERRFHYLIIFLILVLVGGGYFGWEFWKSNNFAEAVGELDAFSGTRNKAAEDDSLFRAFDLDSEENSRGQETRTSTMPTADETLPNATEKDKAVVEELPLLEGSTTQAEMQTKAEIPAVEVPGSTEMTASELQAEQKVTIADTASAMEEQVNNQSNQLIEKQKKKINQKRIKFTFAKDSWVSVKDANNKSLVYDLMRAGEELELKGVVPIRVFLGDATGVSLVVEEENFDISSYINRKKMAKFNVN